MPRVERDGVSLYYEADGDGPTVAFVGDLGYGGWVWAWQHPAIAGPFESLIWDLRGTGRSSGPAGPYEVPDLAADLEAVLAEHGTTRVHLVGLGLGGMVAVAYARRYDRARSLLLAGTSAGGPHVPERPVERLFAPRDDEVALRETLAPVLSESFRRRQPDVVDGIVEWRADGDASPDGWRAQAAAVEAFDASDRLHEVTLPALVVHGTADAVWPPAGGKRLADGLPRGEHVPVEGAGHLVTVERSRAVNDRLVGFLEEHAGVE
ncbi:MAG: alpha/beta hydrolase [Halobacteriales archaeon]